MLYDISLAVRYIYDSPARAARMLLRMSPLSGPRQHVVAGHIETRPLPDHRRDGVDFFGNQTTELAFDRDLDEVEFRFSGRVRCIPEAPGPGYAPPMASMLAHVEAIQDLAPDSPQHFLGRSERVRPVGEIAAFARDLVHPDQPVTEAVAVVSSALHRHFEFDPTATDVTTDPAEAFRTGRGVCQDISHVMISGLRAVGIPAGYVSGFLRTVPPKGQPRLEGADAMHAWVRAWCGREIGWIEIDPTNDMRAGLDHIAVAIGRDYADVAPVKGSLRSAGPHTTEHSVDVVPVAERAAQDE